MLRIKKDVDLKELEKFGFKKDDERFNYKRYSYHISMLSEIMIGIEKREIKFYPQVWAGVVEEFEDLDIWQKNFTRDLNNGKSIIENLINSGIVEKVSEGENE